MTSKDTILHKNLASHLNSQQNNNDIDLRAKYLATYRRTFSIARTDRSSFPSHRFARAETPPARPPCPLPTDLLYTALFTTEKNTNFPNSRSGPLSRSRQT